MRYLSPLAGSTTNGGASSSSSGVPLVVDFLFYTSTSCSEDAEGRWLVTSVIKPVLFQSSPILLLLLLLLTTSRPLILDTGFFGDHEVRPCRGYSLPSPTSIAHTQLGAWYILLSVTLPPPPLVPRLELPTHSPGCQGHFIHDSCHKINK